MEPDFTGWATKAGLKCSDGRTIMPNAFQHQDKMRVPLVWQHGHNDPENVLGHAILENRPDGVYAYGYFNESPKAAHAKQLVEHKDINALSIWANQLVERSGKVLHGAIREVSLVLSGANPGALIDNVTIRHSDGDEMIMDDEAIIFTGLELEHDSFDDPEETNENTESEDKMSDSLDEIYESMNDDQKRLLHAVMERVEGDDQEIEGALAHASTLGPDATIQDVYDSMTEEQKTVLHYMIGEALQEAQSGNLAQSDINNGANLGGTEGNTMSHNVFEQGSETKSTVLSHEDVAGIVADATKIGSLKDAVQNYALSHGIDNIDVLFPDAQAIDGTPEYLKRRTEWVDTLLSAARKSPFARIKTLTADITMEDARAKGYVKGNMKREEFLNVSKRVTTPTTIYKKQKLDRDDIIDITDFDVVTWLKGEMRLMLDEELARAILIGDGRDIAHDDKINEQNIRPIAKDHELFTTVVNVNIDDAQSSVQEIIDALILNRKSYRGTGMPTFFTTETIIAKFLLLKDTTGRRIYKSIDEIALDLRCKEIVAVEAMEEQPDIVGILVNPADYVIGADRGGEVSMFDNFDIDYNNQKYLIETRVSGALVKLKSAIVVKKVASNVTLISPTAPTFNAITGVVTIPTQTGVVYKNGAGDTLSDGAQAAIGAGETTTVYAYPASASYAFNNEGDDTWSFTRE